MDSILQKVLPLSVGIGVKKPYSKDDKTETRAKKLDKVLRKAKLLKRNIHIAQCLYWIGKGLTKRKFQRYFQPFTIKQAKKVYILCEGHKMWLRNFEKIGLTEWRNVKLEEIRARRDELAVILDGARINVGENVNPSSNPSIPQQEETAAAWNDITWNLDDQLAIQENGIESHDWMVTDNSCETGDLSQYWEELIGSNVTQPEGSENNET